METGPPCILKLKKKKKLKLTNYVDLIVEKLIAAGRKAVQDHGGDVNDLRLGFHLPPFNSIGHLHLHVISPAGEMSFLHRLMFRPNSWWFASVSTNFTGCLKLVVAKTRTTNRL